MPSKNPEVRSKNSKAFYEKNTEAIKRKTLLRNAQLRLENRSWLNVYLEDKSCSNCSEAHPAALDFHHIDPSLKSGEVSVLLRSRKIEVVIKEIAKCIILCSNCHRKLHWDKRKNQK